VSVLTGVTSPADDLRRLVGVAPLEAFTAGFDSDRSDVAEDHDRLIAEALTREP
jgi:hypothetical protein